MHYKQLTETQRYQIYSLKKAGHNQIFIAGELGKHPSTISRELKRNKGLKGYRPGQAHTLSDNRKRTAHKAIKINDLVKGWIVELLRQEYSPEQVVIYLAKHKSLSLHHETIYQLIYKDKQHGGDLYKHMRIASKSHRKRYGKQDRRGLIKNRTCIEQRPDIVNLKHRIGDWEGDTIMGEGRKSALLTMVERKTKYTVIAKLAGKHAKPLADRAIEALSSIKQQIHTITLDNGLEFADHERIAESLNADIYFAHPYSSWERGVNENTNGLIRQYFPKGTDFHQVTDEQIQFVMDRLNNRVRKTLKGMTPNELFTGQQVNMLAG